MNITELEGLTREALIEIAKEKSVKGAGSLKKQELIFRILQASSESDGDLFAGGVLDLVDDGYGFLRSETSLIQTMGRAARNENGKVVMYADEMTPSMAIAIEARSSGWRRWIRRGRGP